ncbi:hypothetical protein [Streptomyces sp. NBC_01334]|uniref:hypothetical protein n=1 Tax=Streptomyces sp. NBC_01334 TaxID=2903827 RepID=UPI002E1075D0|nr:hypothetical protein OG736_03435 [Streptomyces sp. NBC_01334]
MTVTSAWVQGRDAAAHLNASQVWQPGLESEYARDDLGRLLARINDEFEAALCRTLGR